MYVYIYTLNIIFIYIYIVYVHIFIYQNKLGVQVSPSNVVLNLVQSLFFQKTWCVDQVGGSFCSLGVFKETVCNRTTSLQLLHGQTQDDRLMHAGVAMNYIVPMW